MEKTNEMAGEAQPAEATGADGMFSEARLIAMLDSRDEGTEAEQGEVGEARKANSPPTDAKGDEPGAEGEKPGDAEEAEAEEPENGEGREKLPAHVQEVIDKRIGKEVAKRKDLEDQLEAERAARSKAESGLKDLEEQLRVKGTTPVAGDMLPDLDAVAQREDEVWNLLEFARRNRDGFDGDEKRGMPAYTAEQMREMELRYERELHQKLPKMRAVLREREQFDREVTARVYPELLQAGSKEQRIAERFLRKFPALLNEPDVHVLIGDMLAGERLRREAAERKPEGKPAEAKKGEARTAVAAPAGRPVGAVKGPVDREKVSVRRLAESGFSRESLAEMLD